MVKSQSAALSTSSLRMHCMMDECEVAFFVDSAFVPSCMLLAFSLHPSSRTSTIVSPQRWTLLVARWRAFMRFRLFLCFPLRGREIFFFMNAHDRWLVRSVALHARFSLVLTYYSSLLYDHFSLAASSFPCSSSRQQRQDPQSRIFPSSDFVDVPLPLLFLTSQHSLLATSSRLSVTVSLSLPLRRRP